ncbi:conserved hypothetical protein [Aspergillus terreus NIH2624]|uniref:Glycosyl transferase family protein n=1 Tax=Aspergillus terreus (strain NIH 2624 / FGSC A1156) TaxID=341663 RepID=Q0CBK2_ASPTN|nr:uncharacterized protein ATEG_08932 [Aspergillus terreus NIH2624]EAU31064.1 conserved hypothetical protein [Aspergillus terreus NIH2624]
MSSHPAADRVTPATKVWTTLITNTAYLPGLLTLDYSLKKAGSKYPLVALYTDTFPADGHAALDARRIPKQRVPYLLPTVPKDFANDVRFYDCWSKLTPFSLVEYERVVQLDSDMLVVQNMDELMDLELDPPSMGGTGERVFAASHACVCNPLRKPHYPSDWYVAWFFCFWDTDQLRVYESAWRSGSRANYGPGRDGGSGDPEWWSAGREPVSGDV